MWLYLDNGLGPFLLWDQSWFQRIDFVYFLGVATEPIGQGGRMKPNFRWSVVVISALSFAASSSAVAQDMSFTMEETGQEAAPKKLGKPTQTLSNALRFYQQQQFEEAAVQLKQVVDGSSKDSRGNVQRAQFFLGKSLYKLRYYQSALVIFDDISQQGPSHLYFGDTLSWLAQLVSQLPESAGIIDKVGRYGVGALAEFKTPEARDLYNVLLYLMGRHLYGQGEFQQAIDLFKEVDADSKQYPYARFFEGISYIRMRKARPAVSSFRGILEALDSGNIKGLQDEDRMRNLAWISLARVYYTAANQQGGGKLDGKFLGQAVEAWDNVQQSSEYWLDALFESSWAFFLADEYARALGNVHALYSPFFENSYYPEALLLKAVTFFVNCQAANADAVVSQFHERYDPVKRELDTILAQNKDNEQFFEFLKKVRADEAELTPQARGIVKTAFGDRTVLRHLEYVALLDAEEQRLGAASPAFQQSSVGAQILQDIALSRGFAVDEAGDLARGRYQRLIRELQNLNNQVDTVELEIATYKRGQIGQELQQQMTEAKKSKGGDVKVDEEHQLWPFDGEYWRDELGFYRQQVTNRCGR